jgi:hypothetical protein
MKYIIFDIQGGIGKNIAATAVVEATKKQYEDYNIIIITPWEEVWFHNPNVYRIYKIENLAYFYADYIQNAEDVKIFKHDPYNSTSHLLEEKHLIETWCELFNIQYNNEQPTIYLTPKEINLAREYINPDDRPILLIQTSGGADEYPYGKESWARDIQKDVVEPIITHYVHLGWRILHVRYKDQQEFHNTEPITTDLRTVFSIFLMSNNRLLIDSFGQHLAAAFKQPSLVCWIANNPKVYGYDIHKNVQTEIKVDSEFLKYSVYNKFDITGHPTQFPYEKYQLFDPEKIVKAMEDLVNEVNSKSTTKITT